MVFAIRTHAGAFATPKVHCHCQIIIIIIVIHSSKSPFNTTDDPIAFAANKKVQPGRESVDERKNSNWDSDIGRQVGHCTQSANCLCRLKVN